MLSQADIDRYHNDGFIVVKDIFSAKTIAAIRSEVDHFVEQSREISTHTALYDLEDGHTAEQPRVRRLKDPDAFSDVFRELRATPAIVSILNQLWDNHGVRFDKAKLNMKSPGFGAAVEWHQDWAFYPHTNDDLAAVGIMLDDVTLENGPMMVVPGSHRGEIHDHHSGGVFCGGIDVVKSSLDVSSAVPLTGSAGSITIHHVRAVHGSAPNRSAHPRRFLLHQYCAADAWPLTPEKDDYERIQRMLLTGDEVPPPRLTTVPVRLPYPAASNQGSIYENQRELDNNYFGTM